MADLKLKFWSIGFIIYNRRKFSYKKINRWLDDVRKEIKLYVQKSFEEHKHEFLRYPSYNEVHQNG